MTDPMGGVFRTYRTTPVMLSYPSQTQNDEMMHREDLMRRRMRSIDRNNYAFAHVFGLETCCGRS
jgi:hypothetical protein